MTTGCCEHPAKPANTYTPHLMPVDHPSLLVTDALIHFTANVTRLNADIHSDQMVLCSIQDVQVLYALSFSPFLVTSGIIQILFL